RRPSRPGTRRRSRPARTGATGSSAPTAGPPPTGLAAGGSAGAARTAPAMAARPATPSTTAGTQDTQTTPTGTTGAGAASTPRPGRRPARAPRRTTGWPPGAEPARPRRTGTRDWSPTPIAAAAAAAPPPATAQGPDATDRQPEAGAGTSYRSAAARSRRSAPAPAPWHTRDARRTRPATAAAPPAPRAAALAPPGRRARSAPPPIRTTTAARRTRRRSRPARSMVILTAIHVQALPGNRPRQRRREEHGRVRDLVRQDEPAQIAPRRGLVGDDLRVDAALVPEVAEVEVQRIALDYAWCDRVDPDALRPELGCQRRRHREQSRLHHLVRAHAPLREPHHHRINKNYVLYPNELAYQSQGRYHVRIESVSDSVEVHLHQIPDRRHVQRVVHERVRA